MKKYGRGEILPEEDDDKKIASKAWTDDDAEALKAENDAADAGSAERD